MSIAFEPMRSLIYVHCAKEKFRHRLQHWQYFYHVPESIAQFGPYVSRYTYYWALPIPPDGERFGTRNYNIAEHYWLVNPMSPELKIKAIAEYFPPEALVWQGQLPDTTEALSGTMFKGDEARSSGKEGLDGTIPFVWVFVPMWWEEDIKGRERTLMDGCNYRWQFVIRYPDGVSREQGDQWLYDEMLPAFQNMKQVKRILTSRILQSVNMTPYQRVVEMWFDGPDEWHEAVTMESQKIKKPSWASTDVFPFIKPQTEIVSMLLSDMPGDDHYSQYRGYIPMR